MSSLPSSTINRLKRIPQLPHVWEGDSFPIGDMMENIEPELVENGRCVLWVDGSEGFVRSMDVVKKNYDYQAMVRALLKAIENPHSPAEPARPQKIIVKDRELQFFLRGALQDLDINVDYQPQLPLLDEIWRNFQVLEKETGANIPMEWLETLQKDAIALLWEASPWDILAEYDIIEIKINAYNIDSLYACVMGMMGEEFGVILYRSLESLKKFRALAMEIGSSTSEAEIESAFLQQDCWFINFSIPEEEEESSLVQLFQQAEEVEALFGSIHPYEGIRPIIDEEELNPVYIAIQAFGQFFECFESELDQDNIPLIEDTYQITIPWSQDKPVSVVVRTMPKLTEELENMMVGMELQDLFDDEDDEDDMSLVIDNELIPDGSFINFSVMTTDLIKCLKNKSSTYITIEKIEQIEEEKIPIVMIQTTRPKAKAIIEQLEEEGGVESLFFAIGEDEFQEVFYDLGIIRTAQNTNYIISEFEQQEKPLNNILKKWLKKVFALNGCCGIVIAMGVTGVSRGEPRFQDILGFFETTLISSQEANLEKLVLNLF